MKRFVRMTLLAAAAASLAACGGGAKLGGGKQGAAQALFQASSPASKKGANAMQRLAAGLSISETVDCSKGGSVTLTIDEDNIFTSDNEVALAYDVEYDGCSEDGKNELDGEMTIGFYIGTDGHSSAEIALALKGRVDISGEVDDFVEADVVEYIGFNGTSSQVTLVLDGTIETSESKYTYNEETITFSATGELPALEESGDDD
jgi:hypothetical protein